MKNKQRKSKFVFVEVERPYTGLEAMMMGPAAMDSPQRILCLSVMIALMLFAGFAL